MQRQLLPCLLLLLVAGFAAAQESRPDVPLVSGTTPPAGAVAVIDGRSIARKDFIDAFHARFARHLAGQQALENLVSQRVIDVQMERRGIKVAREDARAELKRLDDELKKATKGQTDIATELAKKGMSQAQMLDLLEQKIALEKLSALDFEKKETTPAEQQQWLKAKRAEAKIEIDPAKLPDDAAARVYDGFVTREDFTANLVLLLDRGESVKLVEAQMQALLAERLCEENDVKVAPADVGRVYDGLRERFESTPKYQGLKFADFVRERYGMDPATHKQSANFKREVHLTRLGEELIDNDRVAALYEEKSAEYGPLHSLRHIVVRGSDDPKFEGRMRKLPEAKRVIDDVHSRIDKGTMTFEEAAQMFSEDARSKFKKGEWDSFTPAQLEKIDGGQAILGLEVGAVSKPLAFPGGYRLVKLQEKKPVPPLSPSVARDLRRNEAFELFRKRWRDADRGYDLAQLLPKKEDR